MKAIDLYKRDRRNEVISYAITAAVHALLLLLLYWAVLMPPNPPWEEMGGGGSSIAMSLGEENMGGPDLVPVEQMPDPAPPQPESPVEQQQTLTQETEEAPEIEAPKEEKKPEVKVPEKKPEVRKVPEKKPEAPVEKPRTVDSRALFKKKSATGESGGSGSGEVPGNEGRRDGEPGGSPDGSGDGNGTGGSGSGDGTGNGIGSGSGNGAGNGSGDGVGNYDLKGRKLARRPDVTDNSREIGTVVVQIVVDRSGRVVKATPGYRGTTNMSGALLEKARQGALDTRFSPKPDGPEEQYGTMTFVFRFRQ